MTWHDILPQAVTGLGDELYDRANALRKQGVDICPPQECIFRALRETPPDKVKVVILGQDPYHTPGQADGFAFSCANGTPQPSLSNIFDEMSHDLGCPPPVSTRLSGWAKQGVLLLNTSLTVAAHQPNSHADWHWDKFTRAVLHAAYESVPGPVAFILWGSKAINAALDAGIPEGGRLPGNRLVLKSSHPSPFSAQRATGSAPAFLGSRPFSRVNGFLIAYGAQPIDWTKTE